MLPIISKTKKVSLLALSAVFTTTLLSFSAKPGGEGFEIYLDNKLVMRKYNKEMSTVQTLQLDPSYANAQLTVKYHHCGQVAKNRVITIKDAKDKVLKEWHFKDAPVVLSPMACNVKDIISLKKTSNTMNLYYASSELPAGRLLATIRIGANNTASLSMK